MRLFLVMLNPISVRFAKPKSAKIEKRTNQKANPENFKISAPKKLKPVEKSKSNANLFDSKLDGRKCC